MWWKRRSSPADDRGWWCRSCGEYHAETPTDFGWLLPDEVWALDAETRQAHLDWSTDVCHHEGRWFLRGVLEVPFLFAPGRWGWGCWAEVSLETVQKLWALGEADGSAEPAEAGTLACSIPGYPETRGLPVAVQFGPSDKRPLLKLAPELEHPLAIAQRKGIDEAAYHAVVGFTGADLK